jgi:hypothetical protein
MGKYDFTNKFIRHMSEENKNSFEDILLEVAASLFAAVLVFFCFWTLFKS